jgi:glycosyltransferase involved in cell wall biosynthesis
VAIVSTIIPVYNAQPFIRETLEAALAQTFDDHEVIVVDDGSTDGTCKIVEEYRGQVKLLRQENAGPAAARNRGVANVSSEWIAFLDADDVWETGKLEMQLTRAAETGSSFVYTNRENIGDLKHVAKIQSESVVLHEGHVFERLLMGNFITLSSVLMKRSVFEDLGGFNEDVSIMATADWEFWLRVAQKHEIVMCKTPLVKYRFHSTGMSRSVTTMQSSIFRVLELMQDMEQGRQISRSVLRQAYSSAWSVLGWSASAENPRSAVRYYMRAWTADPRNMQMLKHVIKSCLGRT